MFKISIKGLVAHKLRFLASAIAVVLGVAFMMGTGVLTDTVSSSFNDLYGDVYKDTDAVVRSTSSVTVDQETQRSRIDSSLVGRVAAAKGVQNAEGSVQGYARIIDHNGKAIGDPDMGAPTLGGNWTTTDKLNPWVLTQGRAPQGNSEVVIDRASSTKGVLPIGSHTKVVTTNGSYDVTIVGVAKFGSADSPGGASFALFDTADAQNYVGEPGRFDAIAVTAKTGTSQEQVRDAISAQLPDGTQTITGKEAIKESQAEVKAGLGFFNKFMFTFAIVALFVGSFIIYNTFSIVVAQRSREMALLRAIGARRRQVLGSVVLEAAVVGVVASAVGVLGGIAVAAGLSALLNALGFALPAGSMTIASDKIITSMIIGFGIAVVAALLPALRASRVTPMAALRDVAVDRAGRSRIRLVLGMLMVVGGGAALAIGLSNENLALVAIGGGVELIASLVLGPTFAGPATGFLGSKVSGGVVSAAGVVFMVGGVIAAVTAFSGVTAVVAVAGLAIGSLMFFSGRAAFGMTGVLARSNASRNPKRTSSTASALTIGVAIVVFVTVFASSLQGSLGKIVDQSFKGDLMVQSGQQMGGGLPTSVVDSIQQLPDVQSATGVRLGNAEIKGGPVTITGVDAKKAFDMFDTGIASGKASSLGVDTIAVVKKTAEANGWTVGSTVPVRFADTGERNLTVAVIYSKAEMAGDYVLDLAAFQSNFAQSGDNGIYVDLKDGANVGNARHAIEAALSSYPTAKLMDNTEMKKAMGAKFDTMLNLIYVMLLLSIIIALMGIANTLALSVFERTREIGLLRAIGMASAQVRSALRWESAIIALFGTATGLLIGTGFAWAMIEALSSQGFSEFIVPADKLATVVVVAAVAGILAAVVPARKASRMNVLAAIRAD